MIERSQIGLSRMGAVASSLIALGIFSAGSSKGRTELERNGILEVDASVSNDVGKGDGHGSTLNLESQVDPSRIFRVGTKQFPVVIEDGDYDEELLSTVLREANAIYTQLDRIHIGDGKGFGRKFEIGGKTLEAERFIYRDGTASFHSPKGYLDNFGDLLELNGKDHIVITQNLLHEYEKAMEFKRLHEKELQRLDGERLDCFSRLVYTHVTCFRKPLNVSLLKSSTCTREKTLQSGVVVEPRVSTRGKGVAADCCFRELLSCRDTGLQSGIECRTGCNRISTTIRITIRRLAARRWSS